MPEATAENEQILKGQAVADSLLAVAERLRAEGCSTAAVVELMLAAGSVPEEFERLDLNQRLQHLILLVSFTILCVTGFALMAPPERLPAFGVLGPAIFELRGLLHRIAAAWLVGLAFYHLYYVSLTSKGRRDLRDLMITPWRDLAELRASLRYGLGLEDQPPRIGRVSYRDKIEYWALVWGTVVMSVSGTILWSKVLWSPRVLEISRVVHAYEAILAAAAVVVWHLYNVHARGGVFRLNMIWIDGKVSRQEMIDQHPLEFERLVSPWSGSGRGS